MADEKQYAAAIQSAITEDGTRAAWDVGQWRAYFLETTTEVANTADPLTLSVISEILLADNDEDRLKSLESQDRWLYDMLLNGLPRSHPAATKLLNERLDASQLAKLLSDRTQSRQDHLGLGDPKESTMKKALEIING